MVNHLYNVCIYPESGRFEVQATQECSRICFMLCEPNGLLAEVKSITRFVFDYDRDMDDKKLLEKPNLKLCQIFPKLDTIEDIHVFVQHPYFGEFLDEQFPKVNGRTYLWIYDRPPSEISENEEKSLMELLRKSKKRLKSIDFFCYPLDRFWNQLKVCQLNWMSFTIRGEWKRFFARILDEGMPSKVPIAKLCLDLEGQPRKGLFSVIHSMLIDREIYSVVGTVKGEDEEFTFKVYIDKNKKLIVKKGEDVTHGSLEISYQFD